jgi:transcriptional regulator with XRE-family HTH domain
MYKNFIRERINYLRMQHNISEYQLSLDLGHSQGYIQSITSGRTLPSMSAFLDICDYFEITPLEFFDPAISNPPLFQTVMNDIKTLSEDDLLILSLVLKRIISNTKC